MFDLCLNVVFNTPIEANNATEEEMNRKQAEANHVAAVAARRALESNAFCMSEEEHKQAYFQACRAEADARIALVAAEIAFPTEAEQRRAYKKLVMRNRGYDC